MSLKILVVDDNRNCAVAVSRALADKNFDVTAVKSVSAINAGTFDAYDWRDQKVQVSLADFHVALVDGELPGRFRGWDLVPALVAAGVVCVPFSSSSDYNDRMIEAGAVGCSCSKGAVIQWLQAQLLPGGKLHRPCGDPRCGTASGVAEEMTFGHGDLDDNGYWEYPCAVCAAAFEGEVAD